DPPTPSKKEPAGSVRSIDQECGPTTEKRADQQAQCNQSTPHEGGHMTNMPNHPRTTGQSQQSAQSPCPAPDPSHNQASKATKHVPHQHRGHQQETPDPKWQAHPNASSGPA
ncbi:hypothetical protein ATANTOWER_020400, partial [Ataeniobius toweri]|nr:hypothetical protein [Ataeniobius toweri]